jgi:hypothetical protein
MDKNNEQPDEPMFEDISDKLGPAKPMNDADSASRETIRAYKEALEQEWNEKNDPTNLRQTAKQAKEEIAKHVPDYLVTMRGLSLGALSESVKFQATKWLLDNALLPGGAGATDTLSELLEEMEENSKKSNTTT